MLKKTIGKKAETKQDSKESKNLRTILLNAIKMQALYSGGRIKYIDTSSLIN